MKKFLISFVMILILAGFVSAQEIKFIPINNNSLLVFSGSSTKTILCNEERTINIDCQGNTELYELSCQNRIADKEQQVRNQCNQEKTTLNSSLKCDVCQNTNTIQIIDNKNETDSLKGQLGAERKTKEDYLTLLIVSVILLCVVTVLSLFLAFKKPPKVLSREESKKPIKRTILGLSAILMGLLVIPSIMADTITTQVSVSFNNNSAIISTESGNFTYPFFPGQVYPPFQINFNRNMTMLNQTIIYNYSVSPNFTGNFSLACPAPIVNAPCVCAACPKLNYSEVSIPNDVNCLNVNLSKTETYLETINQTTTRLLTVNNQVVEKTPITTEESKGLAWYWWLTIILGALIFLAGIGFCIYWFLIRDKKENKQAQR